LSDWSSGLIPAQPSLPYGANLEPNKEGSVVMQVQNASDLLLVFVGLYGVLRDEALRRLLYWTLLLEGTLGV
jgi:hypothetical protein